jgi:hypothetical protein
MADTMGLCIYKQPRNFPSASVPAVRVKAPPASFYSTSTTFFSVKRQYEKRRGDCFVSTWPPRLRSKEKKDAAPIAIVLLGTTHHLPLVYG